MLMFSMMCFRFINTCYSNFLPNTKDFGTVKQYTIMLSIEIVCMVIYLFTFFMFKAWTVGENYQENKILQKEPVIKKWFHYLQCKLNLFIMAFCVCLWLNFSELLLLLESMVGVATTSEEYLAFYFIDVF